MIRLVNPSARWLLRRAEAPKLMLDSGAGQQP